MAEMIANIKKKKNKNLTESLVQYGVKIGRYYY